MQYHFRHRLSAAVIAVASLAACGPAQDAAPDADARRVRLSANQNSHDFGGFVLHVNAIESTSLTPAIAAAYGISRSDSVGMLNVTALRKDPDSGELAPIAGRVSVKAANLTGQLKGISMRVIDEAGAIYYIGEVSVNDRETINFDIDLVPEGETRPLAVRFSKQFYTD